MSRRLRWKYIIDEARKMKNLICLWLMSSISSTYALSGAATVGIANDDQAQRFVRAEDMVLVSADAQPSTEVVATVGEFAIVRKPEGSQFDSAQGLSAEIQATFVIRDQLAGDYGVSDGTFFVFFHDMDLLQETAREHGLQVEDLFANARMARVSVEDRQDVFSVMRRVRHDPRVRDVELNTTFDRLAPY